VAKNRGLYPLLPPACIKWADRCRLLLYGLSPLRACEACPRHADLRRPPARGREEADVGANTRGAPRGCPLLACYRLCLHGRRIVGAVRHRGRCHLDDERSAPVSVVMSMYVFFLFVSTWQPVVLFDDTAFLCEKHSDRPFQRLAAPIRCEILACFCL